jgi:quinol monooxygenase YgiN
VIIVIFNLKKKTLENHLNKKHYRQFLNEIKNHSQFEIKIKVLKGDMIY